MSNLNTPELITNVFGLSEIPAFFVGNIVDNENLTEERLFSLVHGFKSLNTQFQKLELSDDGLSMFDVDTATRFYFNVAGELVREHFDWTKQPDQEDKDFSMPDEVTKVISGEESEYLTSVFKLTYSFPDLQLQNVISNMPGQQYTDLRHETEDGFYFTRFANGETKEQFRMVRTSNDIGDRCIVTESQYVDGEIIQVQETYLNDEIEKRVVLHGGSPYITKYNDDEYPYLTEINGTRTVFLYDVNDMMTNFTRIHTDGKVEVATAKHSVDLERDSQTIEITVYDQGLPHKTFSAEY